MKTIKVGAATFVAQADATPRDVWRALRSSQQFGNLVETVTQLRDERRAVYVNQMASEFNRGQVVALNAVLEFFDTGEINWT
jgi:hypothetical protein